MKSFDAPGIDDKDVAGSVSIVCPLFNEEQSIEPFMQRLKPVLEGLARTCELIFVDDGCTDGTVKRLIALKEKEPYIRIVRLSRNFGKEAALSAGIDHARGDSVIPIDVDLQDPPELIPELLEKREEGYDVVLAKRVDRASDTFFKRLTANWFYRLHQSHAFGGQGHVSLAAKIAHYAHRLREKCNVATKPNTRSPHSSH